MTYPQSTLEEITDSERAMILDAPQRYGQHYTHARNATMYLTLFITSIEFDRVDTFGRLWSLMKKHHTLAFFSVLRHARRSMTPVKLAAVVVALAMAPRPTIASARPGQVLA